MHAEEQRLDAEYARIEKDFQNELQCCEDTMAITTYESANNWKETYKSLKSELKDEIDKKNNFVGQIEFQRCSRATKLRTAEKSFQPVGILWDLIFIIVKINLQELCAYQDRIMFNQNQAKYLEEKLVVRTPSPSPQPQVNKCNKKRKLYNLDDDYLM